MRVSEYEYCVCSLCLFSGERAGNFKEMFMYQSHKWGGAKGGGPSVTLLESSLVLG